MSSTVVPPNFRLIGSKKNRELGNSGIRRLKITVVNRSSQKLLLSKIKAQGLEKIERERERERKFSG